jgi:serine/threonine-protein kinase
MVADLNPRRVQYRQLSEHFQACVDLSESEREEYLSGPNVADLSLREDLRSLLRYHVGTPISPEAPNPPAPAAVRPIRSAPRRRILAPLLILGLSTLALVIAVRFWTLRRLEASALAKGTEKLQQILDQRASSIRSWLNHRKELVRSVLEDRALMAHAATLADAARGSASRAEALRASPSYGPAWALLSNAPERLGDLGFSLFDPAGVVLCSDVAASVGRPLSIGSATVLRGLAPGEWTVSRPQAAGRLGLELDSEDSRPVLFAGGPVRGDRGQILAYGVFYFSPQTEFYDLLSLSGPARLIAFDERSLLLNPLTREDGTPDSSALRVTLRDPGRELPAGFSLEAADEHWPPTRMCLSATQGRSDSDGNGYRNERGRLVVGAWTWLPELGMGLGAEEDVESLLGSLQPLRSAFLLLLTVPAVLLGVLFFTTGGFRLPGPRSGESIGFYVVEQAIGAGGVGDVFLATHTILGRPAALKILRDDRPSGTTVARFKREARMASRLGHPNSIQIFDYGETPDGRLYYAMEYVEGLNLAQLITVEGALPVGRAVYLLRQIAGALEEAHALGLLHRDLKPSNIMVGRKGGLGDVVKILDFGIASSVSGLTEDRTRSASLAGTPAYMAPERIRRPHQLDFRWDIYSFGGVAFHLLTGRSIFEGPGPAELLYQVLSSPRPSPSKLRGHPLPPALESLVLDCLAIEPDLRPASMSAISATLRSIEMPDPWSQDQARAWWAANGEKAARFKGASVGGA